MKPAALLLFWIVLAFSEFLKASEEVPRHHDEYEPVKWPLAVLKLQQAGTLKDIFDSGLRPYRHPGLEQSLLEVKHLNLTIHLGSGKILPLTQIELINIKVFQDGEISTIEGFTPPLALEHAREGMLEWLPYDAYGRTVKGLDDFLKVVAAAPLNFDYPSYGAHEYGAAWKEPGFGERGGGPKIGLGFRKSVDQARPLRLQFGITWGLNRPIKDTNIYHPTPIPPPPGYEHVDMTAPKKFGPDSGVDILRSQGVDLGESPEAMAEQRRNGERPPLDPPVPEPPLSNSNTPTAVPPAPEPFSWLPVAFVLAGLIILALMVRALRTDKEG